MQRRKKHAIVVGLGFGDEGKGRSVAFFARERNAGQVVRFNGGPQAAHHVVRADGAVHCFSQFGAGSLDLRRTHLSRHVFIEPFALQKEAEALIALGVQAPLSRLSISSACRVVTPFHKLINRMQEVARGDGRHGSCGMGVGQAFMDALKPGYPVITIGLFSKPDVLRQALRMLWLLKRDIAEQMCAESDDDAMAVLYEKLSSPGWVPSLVDAYSRFASASGVSVVEDEQIAQEWSGADAPTVWEGAQGVLLDAERGFWPHVTPSTTTPANALASLGDAGVDVERDVDVYGVLRAYHSRHGAGPFVTESPWLTQYIDELHNGKNEWQGSFRQGWFDLLMARYALAVSGRIDHLVLTQLDQLTGIGEIKLCDGYLFEGPIDSALARYFVVERQYGQAVIKGIRFIEQPTRSHQTGLTQMLRWCRPLYRRMQGWHQGQLDAWKDGEACSPIESYIATVEGELGISVSHASFGPETGQMVALASLRGSSGESVSCSRTASSNFFCKNRERFVTQGTLH